MDPTKDEFKKRRSKQIWLTILCFLIVAILFFLPKDGKDLINGISNLYIIIGVFIAMFIITLISLNNWRCPNCNSNLGNKDFDPEICPKCNKELI